MNTTSSIAIPGLPQAESSAEVLKMISDLLDRGLTDDAISFLPMMMPVHQIQAERLISKHIDVPVEIIRQQVQVLIDPDGEASDPPPPKDHTAKAAADTSRPWRPYPIQALPTPLQEYTAATAAAIGVNGSLVAMPLLGMLASCIGASRYVVAKNGWCEPCILFTAGIAESGSKKSPVFQTVLRHLRSIDADCIRSNREAADRYERDLAGWKKNETSVEKPPPPAQTRHIVNDITPEQLARILEANPRGCLSASDELGMLLAFDRYKSHTGSEAAFVLSCWSAETAVIDRVSKAAIHIDRATMSVIGFIQPKPLAAAIGATHRDNGLLPRFLLAMPPRTAVFWADETIPELLDRRLKHLVHGLLSLDFDPSGKPVFIKMDADAKQIFVDWFNDTAATLATETGTTAAAISKAPAQVLRLALLFHCCRQVDQVNGYENDPTSDAVDVDDVQRAIALVDWHLDEFRRVIDLFGETELSEIEKSDADRKSLLKWIEARGGRVSVRDIAVGPRRFRGKSEKIRQLLNGFCQTGSGRWLDDQAIFELLPAPD